MNIRARRSSEEAPTNMKEEGISRGWLKRLRSKLTSHIKTSQGSSLSTRLCSLCAKMLLSPTGQRALISTSGFQHGSEDEVLRSSHKGCIMCQQISKTWRQFSYGPRTIHALNKSHDYIYERLDSSRELERASGPSEITEIAYLQVRAGGRYQAEHPNLILISPCSESLSLNPAVALHDFHLSSDFVIQRALSLLQICQTKHKICDAAPRTCSLPTRVLDVRTLESSTEIKLYVSHKDEREPYVALSYCWGGDQKVKTTSTTLSGNLVAIKEAELEQTIQDAITITRKLGFQYLWVDALCIIQDDDSDKGREIQMMGEIYKNATITIAAATARSASEGFLGSSKDRRLGSSHNVPLMFPNGQVEQIIAITEETVKGPTGWALDSRAWALQEFVLSRRILIFGDGDVRWHCWEANLEAVVPSHVTYTAQIPRLPIKLEVLELLEFVRSGWRPLLENYTGRHLALEHDRLPEISAIAKEIQSRFDSSPTESFFERPEYFVGLWKTDLTSNLMWFTENPAEANNRPWPIISSSPSFSWASLGSAVKFLGLYGNESIEFIEWGLSDRSSDHGVQGLGRPFPMLIVEAFVMPISHLLDQLSSLCRLNIELEDLINTVEFLRDYRDREGFEVSKKSMLLLVDSRLGKGLILNSLGNGYFRRVGLFNGLDSNSQPALPNTQQEAKTRIQRVLRSGGVWQSCTRSRCTLV